MTLSELDEALTKLHLDLENPADLEIRDKILARHGQSILDVKFNKCKDCWRKEHNLCNKNCDFYSDSDNPIEVSKKYLSSPNDINLFPFLYLYMIPVYEEVTGSKDTMDSLRNAFKKRWKKEKESISELSNYLGSV